MKGAASIPAMQVRMHNMIGFHGWWCKIAMCWSNPPVLFDQRLHTCVSFFRVLQNWGSQNNFWNTWKNLRPIIEFKRKHQLVQSETGGISRRVPPDCGLLNGNETAKLRTTKLADWRRAYRQIADCVHAMKKENVWKKKTFRMLRTKSPEMREFQECKQCLNPSWRTGAWLTEQRRITSMVD